ncbi:polysaccharide biosynthesis/export family protein, partial [Bradyrhizobium sp.]|uniref:polysaccharide biosynthesis/export family protein n=1 Tax=Bradyrhizobium sp. TaxID=376 RepID=UPI00343BB520
PCQLILLGSLLLGGCGLTPGSGPESWEIKTGQRDPDSLPYALVKVTPKVTAVLGKLVPRLIQFAEQRRPEDIRLGIGDIVSVTIFESQAGGLFIPAEAGARSGNFVPIPNQAVDAHGNISVPYAGRIHANGRTPVEVQDSIEKALKDRAIEPQAVVSVVDQRTSMITVLMDGVARRIPASAKPERILDVLGRAGTGTGGPGSDMWVVLERDGRRAVAPFGALIYEEANNVYIHPDDIIYLYRDPQTFLAFGALGAQQQIPFGTWRITLAEAVAKAGGLVDGAADPASVFLYRGETPETAKELGIDCTRFTGPLIPVIYNINFRDPAAYFLATNFEMRNKDMIYVSNSVSVESTKAMTYFNTINSTIQGPITTAVTAYSLKGLITGTASTTTAIVTGVGAAATH